MNEQEQMSQLSALFDNELPPAEADLVIRRALKDPALRTRWERYALIGACVRGEPIAGAGRQKDVSERVRLQLAAESEIPQAKGEAIVPYPGQRRSWSQFGRGALGGAIAAGVAALALTVVRTMDSSAPDPAMQMADAAVPGIEAVAPQQVEVVSPALAPVRVAAADTPPPSYTSVSGNASRRISGPLANYVIAHSEVAAASGRLLPLSPAMRDYDITQGTVEMTEAEIRKYR